ncbi:MAG: hypothetical protein II656_01640 [Ruminococcus sp.]|nr:hypothetical protein [Ruminococcus sp.]
MNNIVDSIIAAKIAGDTYSTGEIDSKLAAKADEADLEELTSEFNTLNTRTFGLGELMKNADDLNNYNVAGAYRCSTQAMAMTLVNCPTTDGFRLEVKYTVGDTRCIQILYPNRANGIFFMRVYGTSGWGSWFKYAGEEII